MIIPNLVIGTDRYGHKLQCGDICIFKTLIERGIKEAKWENIKGMVAYDKKVFFCFCYIG